MTDLTVFLSSEASTIISLKGGSTSGKRKSKMVLKPEGLWVYYS